MMLRTGELFGKFCKTKDLSTLISIWIASKSRNLLHALVCSCEDRADVNFCRGVIAFSRVILLPQKKNIVLIMLALGMENHSGNFNSKVRTIRSKNLRNFLTIYFYTYVYEAAESNPLITKEARAYSRERPPRIPPGLRVIQRFLECSRATAQYYLRAIDITRKIFVSCEIEKSRKEKPLVRITKRDYDEIKRGLVGLFEQISKTMKNQLTASQTSRIRKLLYEAATQLSNSSGVFTPKDCAQIIQELASLLV